MKFSLTNLASATALSVALAFAVQSTAAIAQNASGAPMTRSEMRKANHQLERNVQRALTAAHINITDIRVVAKHGAEIGLDGEVENSSDIDKAADVAGKVPGVTSVKNYLSVYEEGAH
jgi:hyperosmotically inducible periplasmic protein